MRFLTLKVFSFGSSSKPLIDKLFIVDEATGARYLRDLIKDAVKEKDDKIEFNAKSPDQPFFPEMPVINAGIRKFVSADGWYNGSVMSASGALSMLSSKTEARSSGR